jgi:hypothetical protein
MKILSMIITNSGDGSNGVSWTNNQFVLDRMEQLADAGDEAWASGDGLQVTQLKFPDDFDLDSWLSINGIELTTLEELDE